MHHPASDALRSRSPRDLHRALVDTLVQGEAEWLLDTRDLMVALAPFHDCAQRLGIDVASLFCSAADEGPATLRRAVTEFGARTDVTPEAFGFTVEHVGGVPRYRVHLL